MLRVKRDADKRTVINKTVFLGAQRKANEDKAPCGAIEQEETGIYQGAGKYFSILFSL